LKFVNKETELQLIISEELVKRIASYGISIYPNEYGGLLLGRYISENKIVLIEDTVLPNKYKSSSYYFERGSEGLKEVLELRYNASPSLIYVGEWHTHPDSLAKPSKTDINAMSELANDTNVLINNPVLMILEVRKQEFSMGLYFFYNTRLLQYDLSKEEKKPSIKERELNIQIDNNKIE
jgi:integrative and conjugative element protein (TIGR02256 family)